jgi:hypothetical protein
MHLWLLALTFAFDDSPAKDLPYYIAPCTKAEAASGCVPGDDELSIYALEAWQQASAGKLKLHRVDDPLAARIHVIWASQFGGLYGEAEPVTINGKPGVRLAIRPVGRNVKDPLLRDVMVYLTVLHEAGHGLGLRHTREFEDIMYSFQFGGDLAEYFQRYRRKLTSRADFPKHSAISPADLAQLKAILSSRER